MNRIKILQPRYRDNTVLLARYKLPAGQDVEVEILQGAYRGVYALKNSDICSANIEVLVARTGRKIAVRAVPLDKLIKINEN